MKPKEQLTVLVKHKRRESNGVASVYLEAESGCLPSFEAGAHVDVFLPGGIVRQYSLCSDPSDSSVYRIAVLLTPATRGGGRQMHALTPGDQLEISKPRNHFPIADKGDDFLLIAGGIGITPLLCMAYSLHHRGISFSLLYLTKSRSQTPFRKEIERSAFKDSVVFHHSDTHGRLSRESLTANIGNPAVGRHLYVCGPDGLLDSTVEVAASLGWPDSAVHLERFQPSKSIIDGNPVRLVLQKSQKIIEVRGNQTLAKALSDAGVKTSLSCEQGICGTCLVPVLEGEPEHRDTYLSKEEREQNRWIAICCSRAKSEALTLDV
jgi:vanillate O-demethylase ferredoxin subunit